MRRQQQQQQQQRQQRQQQQQRATCTHRGKRTKCSHDTIALHGTVSICACFVLRERNNKSVNNRNLASNSVLIIMTDGIRRLERDDKRVRSFVLAYRVISNSPSASNRSRILSQPGILSVCGNTLLHRITNVSYERGGKDLEPVTLCVRFEFEHLFVILRGRRVVKADAVGTAEWMGYVDGLADDDLTTSTPQKGPMVDRCQCVEAPSLEKYRKRMTFSSILRSPFDVT
ncbi:hypothetical protein M0804_004327 [Polistes exclamans]|nr:hypothetical protein M0804_004327 [Polistes exclamans]